VATAQRSIEFAISATSSSVQLTIMWSAQSMMGSGTPLPVGIENCVTFVSRRKFGSAELKSRPTLFSRCSDALPL
jgi:hypothetical protein